LIGTLKKRQIFSILEGIHIFNCNFNHVYIQAFQLKKEIKMKQFYFLLSGILCLSLPFAYFAQVPEKIIVGTVYNIFHEEFETDQKFYDQVDRDISLMKESQIDHVLIFPMNQWDPNSKQLLWTRTDYLIKKIETSNMKFVPLMLKEEQCSHYLPIWKFNEIDGLWDEHNLNNNNKNNRENIDFADPKVYPLVEEYFKEVIQRFGKSPALSFYNVWNEPHYKSDAEHVLKRFRIWLRKKYGDLSSLRHSWAEDYTEWDQATPFLNDNWNSTMPQIDWIMFKNELNGILLGELIETLRKYDTEHPVNANPVSTPWVNFTDYGFYNTDNWPIADHGDFHGISYYPDIWERGHDLTPYPFWLHNLTFNTVRSAAGEKNYILSELFTNTQNGLALNGYLTKEFVNLLAWTALANDCKGLIYWKWLPFMRGRQSLGRGLCYVNGELAPRGEAVRNLAKIMNQSGELLYKAKLKKSQAAILVDMVGMLKTLEQSTESSTKNFMFESNSGVYKALYEKNISVDLLRMDRGIDLTKLNSYKIIFLPFQIVIRQDMADKLKEYVKQGGYVVADARSATLNELDFAYKISPGAGLDELFGAERPSWEGKKGYYNINLNGTNGFSAINFEGKYFRDHLRVKKSAEILGSFSDTEEPAVILNHYGNGTAILSAVPLGASYHENQLNPVNNLILQFADRAGVIPDGKFISENDEFLSIKVHTLNNKLVVYLMNSENKSKTGSLEINVGNQKVEKVKDIILNNDFSINKAGDILSFPISIEKNQVMVFLLE